MTDVDPRRAEPAAPLLEKQSPPAREAAAAEPACVPLARVDLRAVTLVAREPIAARAEPGTTALMRPPAPGTSWRPAGHPPLTPELPDAGPPPATLFGARVGPPLAEATGAPTAAAALVASAPASPSPAKGASGAEERSAISRAGPFHTRGPQGEAAESPGGASAKRGPDDRASVCETVPPSPIERPVAPAIEGRGTVLPEPTPPDRPSAPWRSRAVLVGVSRSTRGLRFGLSDGTFLVGRLDDAELHFSHAHVSRRHARIECGPEGVNVYDLDSRHGTYVGRRRVQRQRLQHGDLLRFGGIAFRVELPGVIDLGTRSPVGAPWFARPGPAFVIAAVASCFVFTVVGLLLVRVLTQR